MNLTWDKAIEKVLQTAEGAMHYADIAERIAIEGFRKVGANPAAAVAATLAKSLGDPNSPFQRVGKGEYALKESSLPSGRRNRTADPIEDEAKTGALRAFGMYWQRDLVDWSRSAPKLVGRQNVGASDVDFAEQIGVYLLHDRERVIYVGRAADTLVARLRAHTSDRLGGRWDRFSWFGLRSVGANGDLVQDNVPWTQTVVIETLEALLIESLEPPLNRRRGDNFSAVEYLQIADKEIEKDRKKKLLEELAKTIGA